MLQKNLLFLHTAEEDKNYNDELEMNVKTFPDFTTVSIIAFFFCILGLIGNGVILWLLCCTIKRTRFTMYVANLAAGDFFTMLRGFISFLEFFIPDFSNNLTRQLIIIFYFFGHGTQSYFLAAMSIERCLAVFFPVWYQSYRQKCSLALVCTFLWTLSIAMKMFGHFLCSEKYISPFNTISLPCQVEKTLDYIIKLIILPSSMVFASLALCIRMKTKPQQNFPARLDISIWITVGLHLIFFPAIEIAKRIIYTISVRSFLSFYYFTVIFYYMRSAVNPFVYLAVGCWKWEKGQEPCYTFLERALKYDREHRVRMQPDHEERRE